MLLTKDQIIGENQMTHDQKIQVFESLLKSTNRQGVNEVIEYLKRTDFYDAPASSRYHSNYSGGLLDHSLFVYTIAKQMSEKMIMIDPELVTQFDDGGIILCSLLHDLCKVCFYKATTKWKKNEFNEWESYVGYECEDTFPIGHGEKSVIMLLELGLKLTPCEMLAIRFHMGHFGEQNQEFNTAMKNAMKMCPLVSLIQLADSCATMWFETEIS